MAFGLHKLISNARLKQWPDSALFAEAGAGKLPRFSHAVRSIVTPIYSRYAAPPYLMMKNKMGYAFSNEATPAADKVIRIEAPRKMPTQRGKRDARRAAR